MWKRALEAAFHMAKTEGEKREKKKVGRNKGKEVSNNTRLYVGTRDVVACSGARTPQRVGERGQTQHTFKGKKREARRSAQRRVSDKRRRRKKSEKVVS